MTVTADLNLVLMTSQVIKEKVFFFPLKMNLKPAETKTCAHAFPDPVLLLF